MEVGKPDLQVATGGATVKTSFLFKVQEQKCNDGDTLRKPIVFYCCVEGQLASSRM